MMVLYGFHVSTVKMVTCLFVAFTHTHNVGHYTCNHLHLILSFWKYPDFDRMICLQYDVSCLMVSAAFPANGNRQTQYCYNCYPPAINE